MIGSANRPTPKAMARPLEMPRPTGPRAPGFGEGAERADHDEQQDPQVAGVAFPDAGALRRRRREPSSLPAFSCVVLVPQPSNLPNILSYSVPIPLG